MKNYKGEKYIYLLMAYKLAKENGGMVCVGKDNNMVGGQNYYRSFAIVEYDGKIILVETKTSSHFADFSRQFEIRNIESETPTIYDYYNEAGENCGANHWNH